MIPASPAHPPGPGSGAPLEEILRRVDQGAVPPPDRGHLLRRWVGAVAFVLWGTWMAVVPMRDYGFADGIVFLGVFLILVGYVVLQQRRWTAILGGMFSISVAVLTVGLYSAAGARREAIQTASFAAAAIYFARAVVRGPGWQVPVNRWDWVRPALIGLSIYFVLGFLVWVDCKQCG